MCSGPGSSPVPLCKSESRTCCPPPPPPLTGRQDCRPHPPVLPPPPPARHGATWLEVEGSKGCNSLPQALRTQAWGGGGGAHGHRILSSERSMLQTPYEGPAGQARRSGMQGRGQHRPRGRCGGLPGTARASADLQPPCCTPSENLSCISVERKECEEWREWERGREGGGERREEKGQGGGGGKWGRGGKKREESKGDRRWQEMDTAEAQQRRTEDTDRQTNQPEGQTRAYVGPEEGREACVMGRWTWEASTSRPPPAASLHPSCQSTVSDTARLHPPPGQGPAWGGERRKGVPTGPWQPSWPLCALGNWGDAA